MPQAKFSCKENQVEFLNNYKEYGFKDKKTALYISARAYGDSGVV